MSDKDEITRLKVAMFGTKPDGSDGIAGLVAIHNQTLYGSPHNPGGMEADVKSIKRTVWIGVGVVATIEIMAKLLPLVKNFHP
jgi:hypothetical protein